jgi:Cu2+-exporting ATPase
MIATVADSALRQLGLADDHSATGLVTRVLDDGLTQIDLRVPDMRCSGCATRIESALRALNGVGRVRTNPATHHLAIDYDPSRVGVAQLLGSVEDCGYTPLFTMPAKDDPASRAEQRAQLKRIGVAGIAMMQVMMFTLALYAGAYTPMEPFYQSLFRWIGLLFTTPVVAYSAQPFFYGAVRSLRRGSVGLAMDVPVAVAIAAAYGASCWATVTGSGQVYFDSVTMFTFFLLSARYLEQNARRRLARFDDWLAMFPEHAVRVKDGRAESIDVAKIRRADELLVTGGSRVPADAIIVDGTSCFDEALLTGESVPVEKGPGAAVYAGTINLKQPVTVRAESTPGATRIAMLQRLADRASLDRPAALVSADWLARHFITAVLVLAALTYLGWSWIDPSHAFAAAIAVLVVSCPCALSLATPTAVTAATIALRRIGFVVTRADVLDRLADATDVIFDKTGTLTGAGAELVDVTPHADLDRATCVALAQALERAANHPLATAFGGGSAETPQVTAIEVHPGRGVAGRWRGTRLQLGSAAFCAAESPSGAAGPFSTVYLSRDGRIVASFGVRSTLRADADETIGALRRQGLTVEMLSGDAFTPTAAASAALSGVPFRAAVTPEQKLEHVRAIQRAGRRVIMVGDGVNDVPVLAAASVSVTPLEATDLAKNVSDAILLSRGLSPLVAAIVVARRARTVIRQNLGWALAYNVIAIPLAVLGVIEPWVAALGMSASSLLVTTNALRLSRPAGTERRVAPTTAHSNHLPEPLPA